MLALSRISCSGHSPGQAVTQMRRQHLHSNLHFLQPDMPPYGQVHSPAPPRCTKIFERLSVCKHDDSPPSPRSCHLPFPLALLLHGATRDRRLCTAGIDRTYSTLCLRRGALQEVQVGRIPCPSGPPVLSIAVWHLWHLYPAATLPVEVGGLHHVIDPTCLPIPIDNPSA